MKAVAAAFHDMHARLYDYFDAKGEIEVVNLRLSAIGAGPELHFPEAEEVLSEAKAERDVPVYTGGKLRPIPLYARENLRPGAEFVGPAVVAQEDTTFAIPAGARAHVDRFLNLHLTFGE